MIHHRQKPILYVDDTIEQRYAMRRILEIEGFSVIEAGSGAEALRLLTHEVLLAVVDVRLPDMNGYDLTRAIKQEWPFLPVLQVSASFSDPNLRASGLSGGADAYIAQPVHPSELSALVRRIMQTLEAEESLRFLARIGAQLGTSLSLTAACENICGAVIPHFADRALLLVKDFPGADRALWFPAVPQDPQQVHLLTEQTKDKSATLVNSRFLIASLFAGGQSYGAMGFFLDSDREYTLSDEILAADIANRVAMVLQNCKLFASEHATRTALIQAEKIATAGRMAAAIAHEVNNPLEALTNLMYLLEKAPDVSDSTREIATTALGEIMRLAHITRQTLGFYRELKSPMTMDLSESIAETVDLYKKRLKSKEINTQLHLTPGIFITGIKGEIRQVVSNLLVNAFEALDPGGTISIRTTRRDDVAILRVSDNGPGIPEAVLPRIFEPFFTTKAETGNGLGLWITQNIVDKHHGKLSVTSNSGLENHGTEFVLEFPLLPVA